MPISKLDSKMDSPSKTICCCLCCKVDRYKYVTVVSMGPTANNEVVVASRCLLNSEFDTFASYTYDERGLYAVAIVFAFYRE